MYINFRQGIITYPISGNLQSFLVAAGTYVTLSADNGRTDVAIAHGADNYLMSENTTVTNAWGPLPVSTDCWLYWDIDKRTAVRTFGFTLVEPVYGPSTPTSPIPDLHWFNTATNTMYVYTSGAFREVIRTFAAKFNTNVFTPMGYGFAQRPYAGTQVGVLLSTLVGRILVDDIGDPIRRTNGHFLTTEHDFFIDGSPVNILRLESTVLTGTAQLENLHAYQVVIFSEFGQIGHATYNDIQAGAIAILLEDLNRYDTGTVCIQGHITNPNWVWTTVGSPLWIDDTGTLVEIDPHLTDPFTHPTSKAPVARVVTQNSIIFDQGLGGKGDTGPAGSGASLATSTVLGISKLSVEAADASNPIAVGDNDSRMTNARTPLAHNQSASTIIPTAYGSLTGSTLQLTLQQIEDGKLAKSGGTMTGLLTLSGVPINANHAATKAYVDSIDLSSRVAKAGDAMTGYLTLSGDPINAMHAVTKQYADSIAQGLAVKPAAKAATTVDLVATYSNGTSGVGSTLTIAPMAVLSIDGVTAWSLLDGILVKNQTNAAQNGRYYVSQVGSATLEWILTRCGYCDEPYEIPSSYVFVQSGNTLSGTGWVAMIDPASGGLPTVFEVGIDNITYVQFSSPTAISGGLEQQFMLMGA